MVCALYAQVQQITHVMNMRPCCDISSVLSDDIYVYMRITYGHTYTNLSNVHLFVATSEGD